MSNRTESLRRRIDSAGDLQSVVRTMKALAASSIGQYDRSVRALVDYSRTVELGLSACFRQIEPLASRPERRGRSDTQRAGAVVFGSDQGLVGQFNDIVVAHAIATLAVLPGKPRIWTIGERVQARLAEAGLPAIEVFTVPNSVRGIAPLVAQILTLTERDGELDELHLVYNQRTSVAVYSPVSQRLLPLDRQWCRSLAERPWPTRYLPEVMSSGTTTLRALIREYLFISLFRASAESLASENASRLAAMERADRNIDELLETMHSEFHGLRQSDIDEELFDLVAGVELLGSSR